ncbi:hypothetical protein P9314_23115 [Paenibacillus validus]|uniref:Cytosolic protein n=1 Tax=Paenibacillus validus TaxID=44253 RepID=A0A7X2ZF68_9BACL|nr:MULTISPECIES: hypothetical protein [Paenibacillus]MED4603522.1 hypothetical protein [Paenibacillus validus]MED4605349.1 hypothetical protein [Paenibacillus validus]MUG73776.1 hypothetical protein [Paenibacillus validus]
MTPLSNHTDTDVRRIHELNDMNTNAWSSQELHYHQRVMSDLSPWLNAQGSAMLSQIIHEIERRGHEHDRRP